MVMLKIHIVRLYSEVFFYSLDIRVHDHTYCYL